MGFNFGGQPALDPMQYVEHCKKYRLRTDHWLGIANHFTCPLTTPGTGKLLMTRASLNTFNLAGQDKFRPLIVSDDAGRSVTLKKVLMVGHELAITPGAAALGEINVDEATVYVVSLADPRWLCWDRGDPITNSYNLRTDLDGSLITDTLNAGVAWTWQTLINDLWPTTVLGIAPTLPFTPDGTPEGFWWINEYPLRAIAHVLTKLCCAHKYDPVNDVHKIVRLGDNTDTSAVTALAAIANLRSVLRYDSLVVSPQLAQYPKKLAVQFRVRPPFTDGEMPYYEIDQTVTPAAAVVNTAFLNLDDDLTALWDQNVGPHTFTNNAAMVTRAAERAQHWTDKRDNHDTGIYREYAGTFDLTPSLGCYYAEVAWEERGRGQLTQLAAGTNAYRQVEKWGRQEYTDPTGNDLAMWGAPLLRMGGGTNNAPCCCPPMGAGGAGGIGTTGTGGGVVPTPGGISSMTGTLPLPSDGGGSSMTTVPGGIPDTFPGSTLRCPPNTYLDASGNCQPIAVYPGSTYTGPGQYYGPSMGRMMGDGLWPSGGRAVFPVQIVGLDTLANGDVVIATADGVLTVVHAGADGTVLGWVGGTAQAVTPSAAPASSSWVKVTKTFTDFSAAATSKSITLRSFAAKETWQGLIIKTSINFQGGGVTSVTIDVGDLIGGAPPSSITAYDAKAAVGTANFAVGIVSGTTQNAWVQVVFTGTDLAITAHCNVGNTLNQLTQGSLDAWLLVGTLP